MTDTLPAWSRHPKRGRPKVTAWCAIAAAERCAASALLVMVDPPRATRRVDIVLDSQDERLGAIECATAVLEALKKPCEVGLVFAELCHAHALRDRPFPKALALAGSRFEAAATAHFVSITWSEISAGYSRNLREGYEIAKALASSERPAPGAPCNRSAPDVAATLSPRD